MSTLNFSDYLKLTRLFYGLTQSEMARRLGYKQSIISEVETKRKNASDKLKVALTREYPRTAEFERFLYEMKKEE